MYERHGSGSTVQVLPLRLGQVAFLSGAVYCLALGLAIQLLFSPGNTALQVISWEKLVWLNQFQIQFASSNSRPRLISKPFPGRKLLGKVATVDRVVLTSAAPRHVSANLGVPEGDFIEKGKLAQMHRFLTVQFLVAVNASLINPVEGHANMNTHENTHRAFPAPSSHRVEGDLARKARSVGPLQKRDRVQNPVFQSRGYSPSRSIASVSRVVVEPIHHSPDQAQKEIHQAVETSRAWSPVNTPSVHAYRFQHSEFKDTLFHEVSDRLSSVLLSTIKKRIDSVSRSMDIEQLPKIDLFPEDSKVVAMAEPVQVPMKALAPLSPRETPVQPAVAAVDTQLTIHQANAEITRSKVKSESTESISKETVQSERRESSGYVEAFDLQGTPIPASQIRVKPLSLQPIAGTNQTRGWRSISTPQHGITLAWLDESQPNFEQIPLISEEDRNGIQMLSVLTGLNKARVLNAQSGQQSGVQLLSAMGEVKQQAAAGIVYGKIKRGWQIRFSGRSEAPIFLDLNFRSVMESAIDQDRYFAFLNAEPGAHQMFLSSQFEGSKLSVAFPILGGQKTYLDFSQFSTVTLAGQLDEEVPHEPNHWIPAQRQYRVVVLGQEELSDLTRGSGTFEIRHVNAVGSYPLLIESRDSEVNESNGSEFPHRYQVAPYSSENLVLHRISANTIQYWVGKGPGQVNDPSGIVFASVPNLIDANPDRMLIPGAYSIYSSSHAEPKIFTLSPQEMPHLNRTLQGFESRFVGFDLPEGPTLVEIRDEKYQMIFSELVITSPGVVNFVGPY